MKIQLKKMIASIGALALFSGIVMTVPVANRALACGYNQSGGEAFVPRQQKPSVFNSSSVTKEKAVEIVASHIKRLNPDLKVGNVNDNGPLYEAEILSGDNEILQILGVYKNSGRLVVIN